MEVNSPDAKALYDELMDISKEELGEMIKHKHQKGLDLPPETIDQLKKSPFAGHLDLENKMTIREKHRAKREAVKK